jgi:hypothetical protein
MRSRALRLCCAAVAWIALGAAASFLVYSEQHLSVLQHDDRSFDLRARELTDALSDLRVAQEAYVAAGQGAEFWMVKVAQTLDGVDRSVSALRSSARSVRAHQDLETAVETLTQFRDADQRARDYLKADEQLMAADVIFTEGGENAAAAARRVESARLEEHQALDASTSLLRRQEAYALSVAGGLAALVLLVLGIGGARTVEAADSAPDISLDPSLPLKMSEAPAVAQSLPTRPVLPGLHSAAELCTDFGRVRDSHDLQRLIGRAADAMNAAGLVVWLGSAAGADLEPVLAHGYSKDTLARLPNVPRSADNAAAAAYRTGELQIVRSTPGGSTGALVVPIVSANGRIGALSAELRDGGETSESVQALATIVAAQLAGVLLAASERGPDARAAATS